MSNSIWKSTRQYSFGLSDFILGVITTFFLWTDVDIAIAQSKELGLLGRPELLLFIVHNGGSGGPTIVCPASNPIVAPVYNVAVRSDGRVRFTGYANTKTIGSIEHQLTADQLDRLRSKKADYFAKRGTLPRPPHFAGNACNKLDLLSRVGSSLSKFTQVIESENSAQTYIAFREAVESELMTLQYRCPIPNSVKTINGKKTNICRAVVEADGLIRR